MQTFYRKLQGSTCYGKQTQAEEKGKIQQQRPQCSNQEKIPEICEELEKEENRKRAPELSRNTDF